MDPKSYTIPRGSRVLITGANGYIASHTVDQLLGLDFIVRGTVRAPKPWLNEYFEQKHGEGRVIMKSFDDIDSLVSAMDGVSGVIHMASDLTFGPDPNAVIPWVVSANTNILEAASVRKSVKRVVLTSSSRATYTPSPHITEGFTVDENTWNEAAVKAAWDENTPAEERAYAVYSASKTESEKQAWEWIRKNEPHYAFNTILPDFNVGRILHSEISGSTMGYTRKLLQGDSTPLSLFPPQWYVDVEDTARLHIIALLSREVNSERLFAFAGSNNWTDVIDVLHKLRPNNKLIPNPPANEGRDLTVLPSKKAEVLIREIFGRPGWTSLEESLAAGIDGLG